jgi:hypothetical protein
MKMTVLLALALATRPGAAMAQDREKDTGMRKIPVITTEEMKGLVEENRGR